MKKPRPAVLYHTQQATKTRQDILSVAMDIASAEGLEDLSIGRLATELGMSKTGIFAHFGSKEGLQVATVDAANLRPRNKTHPLPVAGVGKLFRSVLGCSIHEHSFAS